MNTTLEQYRDAISIIEGIRDHAAEIGRELVTPRRYIAIHEFEADEIVVSYNDSCQCHPEENFKRFPIAWLFDPDWKLRLEERKEAEQIALAERKRLEEDHRMTEKERSDRLLYEQLSRRYAPTPQPQDQS